MPSSLEQLGAADLVNKDDPVAAGGADTASSPRPLRDGKAPRPPGSSLLGFYLNGDRGGPTESNERLAGSASEDTPGDRFPCYVVGTGRSMPGATKETNAARIMEILEDEANGKHCIPTVGRADGGWCRQQFLIRVSGAGQESWKFFKATYKLRIDYSPDWQWVRVGQGKEIDPRGAGLQRC